MQEMIKTLAAKFGLNAGQVEAAVGALLGFIQSKVPAAQFQQLTALLPQAQQWIGAAASAPAAGEPGAGGLMGLATGLLSKIPGGQGGLGQLLQQLQSAGLKPETATQFVPAVVSQLQSLAGKEKIDQLLNAVPALKDALEGGAGALLGKFMGTPKN